MITSDKYEFDRLDWRGKGYFGCPGPGKAPRFPAKPRKDPWYAVAVAISEAKRGDFDDVARLLTIADQELGGTLDHVCAQIFGDAGPDVCFPELISLIRSNENYEFTFQACEALSTRGRVGDIAVLLDALEANRDIGDADVIPIFISRMLDPGDYSVSNDPASLGGLASYRAAIEAHTAALCDSLGSDEVRVWRGDAFSLERVARWVVDWTPESAHFPTDVRRRLEATSGINCSQFYLDGAFQHLSATAVAEAILESDLVDRLQSDARYFFGHRIPA